MFHYITKSENKTAGKEFKDSINQMSLGKTITLKHKHLSAQLMHIFTALSTQQSQCYSISQNYTPHEIQMQHNQPRENQGLFYIFSYVTVNGQV